MNKTQTHRTHLILRAYIAAARNERRTPETYSIAQLQADTMGTPERSTTEWDENPKLSKVIYQVYGYTASQQFKLGIVEQPQYLENLLICSDLRKRYGDLSTIWGFDKKGNFIREKWNDILIPEREGQWITKLTAVSSRQILKSVENA